jgi:hypothetical protein
MIADYPCYYARQRDDGCSLTGRLTDILDHVAYIEYALKLVEFYTEPGAKRDFLVRCHFSCGLAGCFSRPFLDPDGSFREEALTRAKVLLDSWCTREVASGLPSAAQVVFDFIRHGQSSELAAFIQKAVR